MHRQGNIKKLQPLNAQATFTFHMEYAGGNIHEAELSAGQIKEF